jgi:hypothetical protein
MPKVNDLDRRQVLASVAAMFGTALCAPLSRAVAGVREGGPVALKPLDARHKTLLTAIADRIIPTTDTPGAAEAGVGEFIEMMLEHFYLAEERERLIMAIEQVDAYALRSRGKRFSELKSELMDFVLQDLLDGRLNGVEPSRFEEVKQLTLGGYYSSEIGMTLEQVYLPVPGQYDGAYPYDKVGKAFAL